MLKDLKQKRIDEAATRRRREKDPEEFMEEVLRNVKQFHKDIQTRNDQKNDRARRKLENKFLEVR